MGVRLPRIGALMLTALLIGCVGPAEALAATAEENDMGDWYVWKAESTPEPGEIGLQDWIEKPAGQHGRIKSRGGRLLYNGDPIKLWGLNLCYGHCAPQKQLAEKRAAFYPKYGINTVRLHKYADKHGEGAWGGIQSRESVREFDPEMLDRMDYQMAQLKEQGIFVLLSATFHISLGSQEREIVPYIDEFGEFTEEDRRVKPTWGTTFLAPELQDVQIEQMVNLLEHENPYTGMTYAEDPAVAFVELNNEDSALWYGPNWGLARYPTVRKIAARRFSDWLRGRYGDQRGLVEAWGQEAINAFADEGFDQEHLDRRNIAPYGNASLYNPAAIYGDNSHLRLRMFDTMQFMYQMQNEWYDRYARAIRQTGYAGELLSSNWQAGEGFSHYYNLHSDYRIGTIDRHNYFGGGKRGEPFNDATMLRVAGSGMLSAGMQQVADRPFMLSEWIHVYPNEWGAEGPALIGAYGMGLQGWDVSYMFQNGDNGGFSDHIGRDRWDVTAPHVLGLFPAVARHVLRGDVRESGQTAVRYVDVEALEAGKLDFEDNVTQQFDVKTFDCDKVPAGTLAAARSVVQFAGNRYTPIFDLAAHRSGDVLRSATGQLAWREGQERLDGHITIQTSATRAVVGFAHGRQQDLGSVTITPQSRFAAVYVTARGKESLEESDALLVVAIGRARNTGMELNEAENEILKQGEAPILMEPVEATITVRREGSPTVVLLDHDGRRTDRTLPVEDGTFSIDTGRDETPYYLIQYR